MRTFLHFTKTKVNAYFIVILFFSLNTFQAQITDFPWTETFEDDSNTRGQWTQIYESGTMAWTFTNVATTGSYTLSAHDGTMFANYPANSFGGQKTKLVSPVLDLSNYNNITLSFYYVNPLWGTDQNWLRVFYRVSDTDPWVQLSEFHTDIDPWTFSGEISIPSETYQIALECETEYGYSTLVDHLMVTGDINMGVEDVANRASRISFYPNPAKDILYFKSEEKLLDLEIYTISGQKIQTNSINLNEGSINISSFTPGIYIVKTRTPSGLNSYKVVKE